MFKTRILFALCGTLAAFSANAATICVNPPGTPPCFATVQAAVTAAVAGDTIKIAAGTYRESVAVPAGKDGLILMGSSATKTIIDLNFSGSDVQIDSNNVQIIGLGVHNSTGDAIDVAGTGFIMKKSQVQNAGDDCVDLNTGAGALIEGNRFAGCVSDAVELSGNNAVFKKNRAVNTGSNGFFVSGNNATFEGNICELLTSDCVEVVGSNAIAKKNSTLASGSRTVFVVGNAALVEGNKALGSGGVAQVLGADPQVLKNTATDSDGDAVFVDCNTSPCSGGRIEGNRVKVTQDGSDCFALDFEFNGGVVLKNTGSLCNDEGLEVGGAGSVLVEGNSITSTGSHNGECFEVTGAGVKTLRGNKASRSGGDGFSIADGAHVLEKNSAKNNLQDGFFLHTTADAVQLTGNDASGNGEEGFHNDGNGNTFTDNKAKNNSAGQDFCNSAANGGTFNDGGGNNFGTTTPPAQATVCINE